MQPDPSCTVIMTRTVKASGLSDYLRQYWPLFIDDNAPQHGLDGVPAYFARKMRSVGRHTDSGSLGHREQLTVEFEDGTPGRVFDPHDDVVVHFIIRGADVATGG